MSDAPAVSKLYYDLLQHWNDGDAAGFAALFSEGASAIGFDGTEYRGRSGIQSDLAGIFADHEVPEYVGKVRHVRFLGDDVAVLRGVAGMIPRGESDIDPAFNAVQTVVASRAGKGWVVDVFHTTPAAYHGRPELGERLTEELRAVRPRTSDPAE